MDHTETEFANTGGTTENVEDIESTMENQQYDAMYASTYDHDYGPTPHQDDFGVSVACAMVQNRTANRLPLSTLSEAEHMDEIMDTTEFGSATDSAPSELLQTPSTNVSGTAATPAAPATTPATGITRDALRNALDMAERTLAPRNTATAPAPTTVVQPMPVVRQEARGRQENAGENADRGRNRIKAARGDVASAAEKYYKDMLDIQRQCGQKYVEYLTAKMASEKAMHDKDMELKNKDMELKEAQLQVLRQQLETGATARASTPVTIPPRSSIFNSPVTVGEVEHHEQTPGPPGVNQLIVNSSLFCA